eukprot:TRINITY_DN21728_c4_g1_i1.p1 TRINITY_DN21728_c4_g1~~TRINITY_DN21728_c4_g1_i1.p1  ORF type:complete len:765 (+),score=334.67 TRINITY_DN21728_c4_g1_i1:132-2426(+)
MTKSRFGFNFMQTKPKYTPAEKKGEINELKAQLKAADAERDQGKKRECLKKVIAYMTLGIDTSALFTDMIMACATLDLVQKKMVYLYLCSHAETNPDLSILAINTLQKDCADESPLVRGLALRSISSLRIPAVVEHVVPLLKQCLEDKIPYVRKTAVIAACKLWKMNQEAFEKLNIRDRLHTMTRDNDPHVCCNSLVVLDEIMEEEGGVVMTKQLLYPLLNRMQTDLNEWQKCLVINMVLKYTPETEDEMFNIMNLMEESLRGSNSAVILGATHLFLNLTQNLPQLHRQVYTRLKDPLLTITATAPMETAYTCLCHLKLLISREPEVFADKYKDFYCRYTDPSFTKSLKLEILVLIANEKNHRDIMTELAAYVTDVQQDTVRKAIRAMGEIALKTNSGQTSVDHFLGFLEMDMGSFIRSETLNVLKDFLRKYTDPNLVRPFFPVIVKHWKEMEDTPEKVAFVWILGEYGEHIDDSPYILEEYCKGFKEEPHQVRLEILTACMKLFFKRPPEMQIILGGLLHEAISDFSHADVHDRALLYYRLLVKNARTAGAVVVCRKDPVDKFEDGESAEIKDKLFEEFNTMSVIFNMPADRFIVKGKDVLGEEEEEEEEESSEEDDSSEDDSSDESSEEMEVGLLAPSMAQRKTQGLSLDQNRTCTVDANQYQQSWKMLAVAAQGDSKITPGATSAEVTSLLARNYIHCLATGQASPTVTRFFLHTSVQNVGIFTEAFLEPSTGALKFSIKCENQQIAQVFLALIKQVLSQV